MVFWASLPPWASDTAAEDTSCSRRNRRSVRSTFARCSAARSTSMTIPPRSSPAIGETTMNRAVFSTLPALIACRPPAVRPAPTRPPTSAWDDEVGSPRCQEVKFQVSAPSRAANTTARPKYSLFTVEPMVFATPVPTKKNATKFQPAAHATGPPRTQHPGCYHGGDGVGAVVEAVGVVEEQGQRDEADHREQGRVHRAEQHHQASHVRHSEPPSSWLLSSRCCRRSTAALSATVSS